jgi:hypothetical protein
VSENLTDKIVAYLSAHGWTGSKPGTAGAMWKGPGDWQVAVPFKLHGPSDGSTFAHIVDAIAGVEYRPRPVIAAEILDADASPSFQIAPAWTWIRLDGSDVEILTAGNTALCVRKAR